MENVDSETQSGDNFDPLAKPIHRSVINLQNAGCHQDLLGAGVESAPYEFALLFQAEGWRARRRARIRFKMLRAIDSQLRRMLRSDERVYFVTSGTTTDASEHFFFNAGIAQALNRRALVLTTERVLLLQIDHRQRPRELASQISYASIAEVKATWSGGCRLRFRNGERLNFIGVPTADRRELAALLDEMVTTRAADPLEGTGPALEHLCPYCFAAVPGHPENCPSCHGRFKLVRTAMLRSLLFPGLGSLYLGHRAIAVLEMLPAAVAWLTLFIAPLIMVPAESRQAAGWNAFCAAVAKVLLLAAFHGFDALMTRHYALKGHHPAG